MSNRLSEFECIQLGSTMTADPRFVLSEANKFLTSAAFRTMLSEKGADCVVLSEDLPLALGSHLLHDMGSRAQEAILSMPGGDVKLGFIGRTLKGGLMGTGIGAVGGAGLGALLGAPLGPMGMVAGGLLGGGIGAAGGGVVGGAMGALGKDEEQRMSEVELGAKDFVKGVGRSALDVGKGALGGGAIGAGLGALGGLMVGNPIGGAIAGGKLGAVGGGAVGGVVTAGRNVAARGRDGGKKGRKMSEADGSESLINASEDVVGTNPKPLYNDSQRGGDGGQRMDIEGTPNELMVTTLSEREFVDVVRNFGRRVLSMLAVGQNSGVVLNARDYEVYETHPYVRLSEMPRKSTRLSEVDGLIVGVRVGLSDRNVSWSTQRVRTANMKIELSDMRSRTIKFQTPEEEAPVAEAAPADDEAGAQEAATNAPPIPPEQIPEVVAQLLQSGIPPEQIVQALMEDGVSQEEATAIVQQVMSQMTSGTGETSPATESV